MEFDVIGAVIDDIKNSEYKPSQVIIINMELQAKDLRIGNLIYEFETISKVTVDTLLAMLEGFSKASFEPIPLTDELWKQLVCTNIALTGFEISYCDDDFVLDQFTLRFKGIYIKIKYLHQLQNIVFALTGEELTIKE